MNTKRGFSVPIHIRKADTPEVVFDMMTSVGAQLATAITQEVQRDRRAINLNIVVTLEDATA